MYDSFRATQVELMQAAAERGEIRSDTDMEAVAFEITAFYEGALLMSVFNDRRDYAVLGPRVCAAIWKQIAPLESVDTGNEPAGPDGNNEGETV
jgi:hypothetical protein